MIRLFPPEKISEGYKDLRYGINSELYRCMAEKGIVKPGPLRLAKTGEIDMNFMQGFPNVKLRLGALENGERSLGITVMHGYDELGCSEGMLSTCSKGHCDVAKHAVTWIDTGEHGRVFMGSMLENIQEPRLCPGSDAMVLDWLDNAMDGRRFITGIDNLDLSQAGDSNNEQQLLCKVMSEILKSYFFEV